MKHLSRLFPVLLVSLSVFASCDISQPSSSSIDDSTISSLPPSSSQPTLQYELYQNPIYDSDFPDPTIVRHSDGYFYACSSGTHIIISAELANGVYVGRAIETRPTWGTVNANIWAPDVVYINGQYVMYYSLSRWDDPNPGIGIATSNNPAGPWIDHGKMFLSDEIGVNNSIDPMVFVDLDGRVYMIWGSFRGIYAIELTADGLDFVGGNLQSAADNKTRLAGYDTDRALDVNTFEGAYVIYRDGYYYLFLSNGQCCGGSYSYNVRVARATSILGPYEDASGRSMLNGDVGTYVVYGNSIFVAPGHNSIVRDDAGDDWLLYHAYPGEVRNKRVLLLDKLLWDERGFPALLGTTPSNNQKKGPQFYR
jgi:arabinan endo-1,5-alpha-L-arabinosidase